jgi:hypothetical protein
MTQYKISDRYYIKSPTRMKLKSPKHNGYAIHYVQQDRIPLACMELNGYSRFWIAPEDNCWRAFCNGEFDRDPELKLKDVDFAWYLGCTNTIGRSIKLSTHRVLTFITSHFLYHTLTSRVPRPLPRDVFDREADAAWELEQSKIKSGQLPDPSERYKI